ncbi:hypothetical protein MNBD_GAMMA09-2823 [hydrothermal vent metagenome]|uniref:Zinc-ribbon containing domain-containing protein n=1 Tax=hydrothermal vent metagenome TaxID=652676 RepID=A0A3B0XGG9_9ZZZZ
MKKPAPHDPIDILGEAYEKMYERSAKNLHQAKDKSSQIFHGFINQAKEKAVELEELTEEDAAKVASWLKRDMNDFIDYLVEGENEIKDWLGFETNLLENVFLDLMLQTADKTTIELLALKKKAKQANTYHTGEVTGPGTLVCEQCGEVLHFHKAGKIPPCAKCHATTYQRKSR